MKLESKETFNVNNCLNELDLYNSLLSFAQNFGLSHFSVMDLPGENDTQIGDLLILSNWPDYLVQQYDRLKMMPICPVINTIKSASTPIEFLPKPAQSGKAFSGDIDQLLALFEKSGFGFNIGNRVESRSGRAGIIIFSAAQRPANMPNSREIHNFSNMVFAEITKLNENLPQSAGRLSKREHECVLWTSQGKTSFEIGMILGLSENTINNYLVSACRKLGAVNRPHMVTIALQNRII